MTDSNEEFEFYKKCTIFISEMRSGKTISTELWDQVVAMLDSAKRENTDSYSSSEVSLMFFLVKELWVNIKTRNNEQNEKYMSLLLNRLMDMFPFDEALNQRMLEDDNQMR
jgi:hypothetical protein